MRVPAVASIVVTLALAGAFAAPATGQEKQEKDTLATLEAKFEPARGGGSMLTVRGSAKKLPSQTRLIVKLLVKGWKDPINIWEVTADNGGYQATIGLENREAAPLVYHAELWLMVAKQVPPVKRALQRDLGVSDSHNEVLDAVDIAVGSDEERARFGLENVKLLDDVLARATAEYDLIEPWLQAAPGDFDKKKAEVHARLRTLQERYNGRARKYLTLGEATALGLCRTVVGNAIQALDATSRQPEQARTFIDEGRKAIERLRAELTARLEAAPRELKDPRDSKDSKEPEKK